MDKLDELLLTVWALSQEGYKGPISHAIPRRLHSTLSIARSREMVCCDDDGPYLEERGSARLIDSGLGRLTQKGCMALLMA